MRFSAPYIGSSAIAGRFDRALLMRRDAGGQTVADAHAQGRPRSRQARRAGAAARRPARLSRGAHRAGAGAAAGGSAGRDRDARSPATLRYSVTITGMSGPCRHRADAVAPRCRGGGGRDRALCRAALLGGADAGRHRRPARGARTARSTSFRAAATSRSTSAPATTPRAMPLLPTCSPRSSGSRDAATSRVEVKEIQRGPAVPCSPQLQAQFARAIERAGHPRVPSAERRRPRRRDVQRRHRHRHAVRALRQRRHQSFAAARRSPRRTPTLRPASSSIRSSNFEPAHDH